MKKQRADQAVTIPANSTVGLSAEQYAPRAHNLSVISDEGQMIVCDVINPIQFKTGEEFFAEELPKSLASLVMVSGAEDESGAGYEKKEKASKTGKVPKAK